ncbi:DUF998 domain-containing protein [Amycolatopsis suaedae]|uniref:DUF998 domain-containing protein n=1 Tax=Amycolatopsis suaedae TaxID=2510978 RepID=A0A4Q7JE66_9PSEU|nr:DUF998 domain-containing protein [Amycolatopsis suaedae]RZQ65747.1 DUF998 domain-containing protein [Amycolatopsis suaedae]
MSPSADTLAAPAPAGPGDARALPFAGVAALLAGSALLLLLHVLPPTDAISPVYSTISQYALTDSRWLFDLGIAVVAAGSAAVFATLIRRRIVATLSFTSFLGFLWVASLIVLIFFQKTNWAIGPSVGGTIHRWASVVAFVSLPLAVIAAARRVYPDSPVPRRLTVALGVTSLMWFGVILTGVVVMLTGGGPWWTFVPLGLVERFMAVNEVLALGALTAGLLRPQPSRSDALQLT